MYTFYKIYSKQLNTNNQERETTNSISDLHTYCYCMFKPLICKETEK